jgi:hypothetical protein
MQLNSPALPKLDIDEKKWSKKCLKIGGNGEFERHERTPLEKKTNHPP